MKNLFITATGRDKGKTVLTLGLHSLLMKKFGNIGYMKPLGQRYVKKGGVKIDEDVELITSLYDFPDDVKDMSPVIMDRGFTEKHIMENHGDELEETVLAAYNRLNENNKMVVIEGSGKVSVGEVFGLSNVRIAELTNTPVILIAEGGVGRTIDECALNLAYLQRYDIDILGVIINKVYREKIDKITEVTGRGLKTLGLDLLGVIPYEPILTTLTPRLLMDELKNLELITEKGNNLERTISSVLVGAMKPHQALNYFEGGELLVTGGDREDILIAVLCWAAMSIKSGNKAALSGIILTGNSTPHNSIINVAEKMGVNLFLTKDDTYTIVSRIKDLTVKIRPEDKAKIEAISSLIGDNIDLDRILNMLD